MKISLNWIRDFVSPPSGISGEDLARQITLKTAEVEGVEDEKLLYENIILSEVVDLKKHPGADKLMLVTVNAGESFAGHLQLVCGGQNLKKGMKVALALPGAKVRWHGEGDYIELTETKIRGESSFGMICAGEEIGLESDNPKGAIEVRIKDLSDVQNPIGTPISEVLGKTDLLLDIDNKSLTHRPDLWGHYGMAREVSAIFGVPLKPYPAEEAEFEGAEISHECMPEVDIQDEEISSRFSMIVMSGIEISESPEWMKSRLRAAGMNAHNNVVDITNYVMLELGQPMHAYDRRSVPKDKFIVRCGRAGETLVALDESSYELHTEDPIVCTAEDKAIGIAGIKGGLHSGISADTSEIILEAAQWNAVLVRKASTRLGLRTDASQRFEKNLDPSMTEAAIRRAANLILELCPNAKIISPLVTRGAWVPKKNLISVRPEKIRSKLGLDLSEEVMLEILKNLEFKVNADEKDVWTVEVPNHRACGDVGIEEDIIEEIARMYGYDKIPATMPMQPLRLANENYERRKKHELRRILAKELGFFENINYSFYGETTLKKMFLNEADHVMIENFLSEDQTHMRQTLVPRLVDNVVKNQKDNSSISIFEFGRTYKKTSAFMPLEEKKLAFAIAKKDSSDSFGVFSEAQGALEALLSRAGTHAFKISPASDAPAYAHPKSCVDISVRGKKIGHLFRLHPACFQAYDLEHESVFCELNFSEWMSLGEDKKLFKEPSKFPGMSFDVSLIVDKKLSVGRYFDIIKGLDKEKLIEKLNLVELYEGKHVPSGKKSILFSIDLRHSERTLTEEEFHAFQEACFVALEKEGATIRGRS